MSFLDRARRQAEEVLGDVKAEERGDRAGSRVEQAGGPRRDAAPDRGPVPARDEH